jgi:hypothetical protein
VLGMDAGLSTLEASAPSRASTGRRCSTSAPRSSAAFKDRGLPPPSWAGHEHPGRRPAQPPEAEPESGPDADYPHLGAAAVQHAARHPPGKAEVIMAALADRFGVGASSAPNGEVVALHGRSTTRGRGDDRAPATTWSRASRSSRSRARWCRSSGTLRPYSGMTGYDGIRQNFLTALEDPAVRAIVLDIDSPGGEVAGCFDLVDTIYAARGEKPIWAILDESAYSAAYAIASAPTASPCRAPAAPARSASSACTSTWSRRRSTRPASRSPDHLRRPQGRRARSSSR